MLQGGGSLYDAVDMKNPAKHVPQSLIEHAAFVTPSYVRYNVHMKKIMTATDARKDFFNVIEAVGKHGRTVTITREGMPPVMMMSVDEYEGWMETMEIMSDPDLVKQLREVEKEKGQGTITLEELMQEERDRTLHVQRSSRKICAKAVPKSARKGSAKSARRAARVAR